MSMEPTFQQFSLFENESNVSADAAAGEKVAPGKYSNFVVYVDESGDHGMQTLDANYPVFVLAFCVFYKRHYRIRGRHGFGQEMPIAAVRQRRFGPCPAGFDGHKSPKPSIRKAIPPSLAWKIHWE